MFSQKKVKFELSSDVSFPVGKDKFKIYKDPENPFSLQHYSAKKFQNPFISLKAGATYPITSRFSGGIQTGVFIFFRETHFLGTVRTFPAIPIQATFDVNKKLNEKQEFGVKLAPGILLYEVDEVVYHVTNALLLDGELYFNFSKKSKLRLGWRSIQEWANFEYYLTNTNATVKHKFQLARNSVYAGYSFLIN